MNTGLRMKDLGRQKAKSLIDTQIKNTQIQTKRQTSMIEPAYTPYIVAKLMQAQVGDYWPYRSGLVRVENIEQSGLAKIYTLTSAEAMDKRQHRRPWPWQHLFGRKEKGNE